MNVFSLGCPVVLTPPESAPLPLAAIPDTVFDLEGDSDDEDDHTTASLPLVPVQEPPLLAPPVDLQPPLIPAVPVVPAAAPRRTMRVSRPPGEWWKVKHPAEPEAEAPVIWSDDEEDALSQDKNLAPSNRLCRVLSQIDGEMPLCLSTILW